MKTLFDRLRFRSGASMANRFMLAPLTNLQSHPDGTLSEEEFHWLTLRAGGGFGLVPGIGRAMCSGGGAVARDTA